MWLHEPTLRGVQLKFWWEEPPLLAERSGSLAEILREAVEAPDSWSRLESGGVLASNLERALIVAAVPEGVDVISEIGDVDSALRTADAILVRCMETVNAHALWSVDVSLIWSRAADSAATAVDSLDHWAFPRSIPERLGFQGPERCARLMFETADDDRGFKVEVFAGSDDDADDRGMLLTADVDEYAPGNVLIRLEGSMGLSAISGRDALAWAREGVEDLSLRGERLFGSSELSSRA